MDITDFDIMRIIESIKNRISKNIDGGHLDHADILTMEVIREYQRIEIKKPDQKQITDIVSLMFETGSITYKIEIGDFKFNMRDYINDFVMDDDWEI